MQRQTSCVLAILLAFAPACIARAKDSVPDWVRAAAASKLPAYPANTNAVVLLDETAYTVQPDGKAIRTCREAIRILRPQGREDAMVSVPFDKDSKISFLHVWSIGADGHEYALKDNEIIEAGLPGEGGQLYDDEKFKVARPQAADPGAVIAFEYEQKERPYISEEVWDFQRDLPHLQESFTLQLPPGFEYKAVWAHHAAVEPTSSAPNTWTWQMKDVPGIDTEDVPLAPSPYALASRMSVHYFGGTLPHSTRGDWLSIGEWYDNLSHDRMAPTPEIAAKAQELVAGKSDFAARADAVATFVQTQIRYFVIEIGIGGNQPHPAGDIFRNRYGDCKDKATLLEAMLSTVGIRSTLVAVDDRRGVVDPAAPSRVGNHMIAAIELPAGYDAPSFQSVVKTSSGKRFLIFDPTNAYVPFGQIPPYLQAGYGLLIDGAASQIVELPVIDPRQNTIDRVGHFQLQADGTLAGEITEKRFGSLAESKRYRLTHEDVHQQTEQMDHSLQQDFSSFTMTGMKTTNIDALDKDLTQNYTVTAPQYARSMGQLLLIRPRVFGSDSLALDRKPRVYDIDLDQTETVTDEFDVELPAGYTVDEVPEPVSMDVGFAAYKSSSEMKGNMLRYTRTYTINQVQLNPDKYADLQKIVGTIEADERSQAILKKSN